MDEGIKHDTQKSPWHLLPYRAVGEVVKVLRFGSSKYTERNWERGIKYSRCFSAAQRHLVGCDEHVGWWNRAEPDIETKTSHLANAICELLFLLNFELEKRDDLDDRPGAKTSE